MNRLNSFVWFVWFLVFLSCGLKAEEQKFERFESAKTFYIVSSFADTMSSPDQSGYVTGSLKRSDAVEAYGRLGQDWVAIRPPSDQFDWISAEHAHLLSGGLNAEILDKATPAFMNASDVELGKLQWQIKLQPTQQVNVIGQYIQRLENGKSRAWYKIQPPAGEFRWIQAASIAAQPPKVLIVKKNQNSKVVPAAYPDESAAMQSEVQAASAVITDVESEPIILGPGESIVAHDDTPLWNMTEGETLLADDQDMPGSYIVDESGEIIASDSGFHADSTCPNCTGENVCDACDPDFGKPIHRLRPIGRLLSCFGLALVEAEGLPAGSCGGCGLATCGTCSGHGALLTRASSIGSLPSRLDSLPRPARSFQRGRVDDSLLMDRLGDARRNLRDSFGQASTDTDGRESILANSADVSLGTPVRNALSDGKDTSRSRNTDENSWNGLPVRGVDTSGVELDVQAPTSQEEWSRRPAGESSGSLLKTSTPTRNHQSNLERPNSDSIERFSDQRLRYCAAELTTIVARPTEQWQLGTLRQEVEQIIENGHEPLVRGEARLLLERIDEFESFRARWMRANFNQIAMNHSQTEASRSSGGSISMASYQKTLPEEPVRNVSIPNMEAAREIINSADAAGWLVAVHSDRSDYPRFALTDDAGKLVAYVESSPALNLRGYLQQPVAIHGQRGMNVLLNARSIYAERVIRLADAK